MTHAPMSHPQVKFEEQMKDGRDWMASSKGPSFIDISMHSILSWLHELPEMRDGAFNEAHFPLLIQVRHSAFRERKLIRLS